MNWNI